MYNGQGFSIESEVIKELSKITKMKSRTVPDHSQEIACGWWWMGKANYFKINETLSFFSDPKWHAWRVASLCRLSDNSYCW